MITIYDPSGDEILTIEVDDDSYRYQQIMGNDEVNVRFSLTSHTEIPVGSYIIYNETKYSVLSPSNVVIRHRRDYEYLLTFQSSAAILSTFRVINPVDGRLKFPLTVTAQEHLDLLVANLNLRDSGWQGTAISTSQKVISYNFSTGMDVLNAIASEYETEWEIIGKHIYIGKVEHNKSNPISLSYGGGNGFLSGVSRTNHNDANILGKVYVQGGERNIVKADYGATTLHLPKNKTFNFDGKYFQGESGYGREGRVGVGMKTDSDGYSVFLQNSNGGVEGSLDLSEIYPHRNGRLTSVLYWDTRSLSYVTYSASWTDEDWENIQVDVCDSQIPASLDYDACQIAGEKMTIRFETGQLAGHEFDIQKYYHDAISRDGTVVKPGRRFELVKTTYDGFIMPGKAFIPIAGNGTSTGDEYGIFNISLPAAYVSDGTTFSGAEYEALREAATYLYDNKDAKYTFKGELDSVFSARNWANINSRIILGGFVSFTDEEVQPNAFLVRILGIKTYLNRPHCPVIELSNDTAKPGMASTIKQIEAESVALEEQYKRGLGYTKRSFQDAKETAEMLVKAGLEGFEGSISPITVQTMQMLVGDEALQFRFWTSRQMTTPVTNPVSYNHVTKEIVIDECVLQHCTLGINDIRPASSREADEFKMWDMYEFTSDLSSLEPSQPYYIYARCENVEDTSDAVGEYLLSESPIGMTEDYRYDASVISAEGDFYYFLVGILNAERDESRSFAPLFGFTEILPGQITTDVIRSGDGENYFDLVQDRFRIGNSHSSLAWNENGDGVLRLIGNIVQSPSGEEFPIPCPRGEFVVGTSHAYYGDLFTYNGETWLCIDSTAIDTAHSVTTAPSATSSKWRQYTKSSGSKLISIVASSLYFAYNNETDKTLISTSPITLTADAQNVIAYKWQYKRANGSWSDVGSTAATLSVAHNNTTYFVGNDGKSASFRLVCTDTGYTNLYDEITILKLYGGKNGDGGITAFLSNTSKLFEADTEHAIANTDTFSVLAFKGVTPVTPTIGTITGQIADKITASVSGTTITVSVTTALTTPSGTLTIPVTVEGQTINLKYSWALSFKGGHGDKGSSGPTVRGPVNFLEAVEDGARYFYDGDGEGEEGKWIDIVYYGGAIYKCVRSGNVSTWDPTMWEPANEFSFVATSVLYAAGAVIENAVIRKLLTADNPNARIEASDSHLDMYDGDNIQRLHITADEIDLGSPSVVYSFYSGAHERRYFHNATESLMTGSGTSYTSLVSFHYESGNSVSVGNFTVACECSSSGASTTSGVTLGYACITNLILKKGNITLHTWTNNFGQITPSQSKSYQFTVGSEIMSYLSGTGDYSLELYSEWGYTLPPHAVNTSDSMLWINISYTGGRVSIDGDSTQLVSIGSNGVVISNGGGFVSSFGTEDGAPSILFQGKTSGGSIIGIKIDATGAYYNQGGGWVLLGQGSGGGSNVTWTKMYDPTTGKVQIASIKIGDADAIPVYAPSGTAFDGGEIHNDLWLHTNSANYGSRLDFGNKTVYLDNDSTGHLKIYASAGISLDVGTGYNVNTNASFYDSSDERLKDIVAGLGYTLDDLRSIPKVIFSWKNDESEREQIGTIAQGIAERFPQLVNKDKDGYYGVNYDALGVVALHGIDLLADENEKLRNKVEALEERLSRLEKLIG